MSKKQFKSQASSGRAAFGSTPNGIFGASGRAPVFGATSSLSYISDPPVLSNITDPNVVVALKGLSKKDATTKSKALEDLLTYALSKGPESGGVQDGVLEAWTKMYPRTSIDNSRRVRQLAHTLQAQVAVSSGKRIAKHMPKVVGAWLSGLYDSDRLVSRTAREALERVFPSKEKIQNIWRAYERPILEFTRDSVLRETVQTLSDERTVSPDDAEAKYARVVATAISLLSSLLAELEEVGAQSHGKEEELLFDILNDKKLWAFASHNDAFVRRSIYRLIGVCVAKKQDVLSKIPNILSTEILSKGLNIDQSGSALHFSEALAGLTTQFPALWTDAYTAKRPAALRLRQYLKRGSQGGPQEVWENISQMIRKVPPEVLAKDLSQALDLLENMLDGISSKGQSREDLQPAWKSYVDVLEHISELLNVQDQQKLVNESLLPMLEQYVRPSLETARWSGGPHALLVCASAVQSIYTTAKAHYHETVHEAWSRLAQILVDDMRTSAPEQSTAFERSQKTVAGEGERWALLNREYLRQPTATLVIKLREVSLTVAMNAMQLLKARNGKPHGSANILHAILHKTPELLLDSEEGRQAVSGFFVDDFPSLWRSPSFAVLASGLGRFGAFEEIGSRSEKTQSFQNAFRSTARAIVSGERSNEKVNALQILLSATDLEDESKLTVDPELEAFVVQTFQDALEGSAEAWGLVNTALLHGTNVISADTTDMFLSEMTDALTIKDRAPAALQGLDMVAKTIGELVRGSAATHSSLLGGLLALTESKDENLAAHAEATYATIESVLTQGQGTSFNQSIIGIIVQELTQPGANSVSVDSLVERAHNIYIKATDRGALVAQLFPTSRQWQDALAPFMEIVPGDDLVVTDILGGSLFLASSPRLSRTSPPARDLIGRTAPLRTAMYVTQLLVAADIFQFLPLAERISLVRDLLLTVQLANDNFSLPSHNTLWHRDDPRANEEEILDFVFSAQAFWKGWLRDDKDAVSGAREQLRKDSHGLDPRAFYNARAFAYITEELVEVYGVSKVDSESWPQHFREGRIKSDDLYLTIAMSIGFKGPMSSTKVASRLCNELVSDLTGLEYRKHPAEALRMLVLLNAIVQHQDTANDIPPHRLVPFVKSLLDWWGGDDHEPSVAAAAEVAKVLTIVLPVIQDVYGGHWSRTTKLVKDIWLGDGDESNAESRLPAVHASLKLFGELKKIHHSNDDADDAYKEAEFPTQLASLVREIMPDGTSDKMNQPLKVVNSLLCRMLTESGPKEVDDPNEFCRLLYVESASIQLAGFRLLHRLIPAAQEQISLEAALSKKDAHVSEVLLSLLVDAPTLETLAEARWEQSMPLHLRGYLFSWMLVFDHFTNSSYKVRSDYVADLKKGDYLKALLDLTFDFLGHDRGKPVDASKFDIRTYVPDTEESPERDTQWLLTHIYFLCLKNLASLTKAWWIEHAGRHKSSSIETWTEKYVSALVIADELATVSEWVASDEQEGDEQPLKVKVSRNAREVTAGYEVDEQTMEIAIKLPGAYPLGQATVEGLHRVGVDEKRWRSWLLNTQGVITFSNGSIVDGLTAWRKNVTGALKGQTECAICYSIISADKQLPSKRCGTCKNLFHSSCLYKWFKSSNSSSCPLCRNPFNYG